MVVWEGGVAGGGVAAGRWVFTGLGVGVMSAVRFFLLVTFLPPGVSFRNIRCLLFALVFGTVFPVCVILYLIEHLIASQ